MQLLKQSTTTTIQLGPFLDSTDGVTAETGLTVSSTDVYLSKAGAAFANPNDANAATHDRAGWYRKQLNTTDTNTLGRFVVEVQESGALPVWREFMVVPANVFDSLVGGSDNLEVDAVAISGDTTAADNAELDYDGTGYAKANSTIGTATTVTNEVTADVTKISGDGPAADNAESFFDGTGYAGTNNTIPTVTTVGTTTTNTDMVSEPPTAAANADAVWDEAKAGHVGVGSFGEEVQAHALTTDVDAVPTAVENRTEMDSNSTQLAAIVADTNELQTDDVPGLIAALNDPTAATVADAVWDEALAGHVAAGSYGKAVADIETDATAILADTNELQTDDIPGAIAALNDISTAQVNTEVDTALADVNLDHLLGTAAAIPAIVAGTYFDQLVDDGTASFDRTTDSLQALRDRGDTAWITGGGGGITDILNVHPLIPESVDLANTATWRLGLMLINSLDDLPSAAEITPGTIDIDRKAIGGTTWSSIVSGAACLEDAGLIYYDEVFDTGTGYAEGDSIRITFKSQKITVAANDYEISDATGRMFYTEMRQTERGTDSAYTGTPPTAIENRQEMDNNSTQLAAIVADTNELQTDDVPGLIAALNDPTSAAIADAVLDEALAGHVGAGSLGKAVADIETDATAILADTNELQSDWVDGGRLDLIVDATLADTNELQSDDVPGLISALNDPSAATVADAVWNELATGHTDAGKAGQQLWTDVDAILADTNELQSDDVPTLIAALPTAVENRTEMDSNSTQLTAIVADTNELQVDWVDGGRLDLIVDAILADTNELQADDVPSLIAALNDLSAAEVNTQVDAAFTTQMADSVPADGTIATREQAIYMIVQWLTERAVSGTTVTVKKVDGSTSLMTFTLSDATEPVSITRAT